MEDGEGRMIDFRNTLILLTSNVGSELIMNFAKDPDLMPAPDTIAKALREPQLKVFPAALLGRIVSIPYYPLSDEVLHLIIVLQLKRIVKRMAANHEIPLTYTDAVLELIAARCTELESGGRMIDAILTNTVLPQISRELLTRMAEGTPLSLPGCAKHGLKSTSIPGISVFDPCQSEPPGQALAWFAKPDEEGKARCPIRPMNCTTNSPSTPRKSTS